MHNVIFQQPYNYIYIYMKNIILIFVVFFSFLVTPSWANEINTAFPSDAAEVNPSTPSQTEEVFSISEVVTPDAQDTVVKTTTKRTFSILHQPAPELAVEVETLMKGKDIKIVINSDENTVEITADESLMEDVTNLIRELDQPKKEISLDVRVLQIILNDEYDNGVDWEAVLSDVGSLTIQGQVSALESSSSRQFARLGKVLHEDYDTLLEALDTVGIVRTLSQSQVTSVEDQSVELMMSFDEPYVITLSHIVASGGETIEEGGTADRVKFHITPKIGVDDHLTLSVVSKGQVVKRPIGHASSGEPVSKDVIKMLLEEGSSIVVGGLIKSENVETLRKIPVLGDLPILGFAFRNPNRLVRRTEFILLLTPKVVNPEQTN